MAVPDGPSARLWPKVLTWVLVACVLLAWIELADITSVGSPPTQAPGTAQ